MDLLINAIQADPDSKARVKARKFHEVTESNMIWMILQIKSSLYFTMMFILIVSTQECTVKLDCETPRGLKTSETFKLDTSEDGKLDANHDVH